MRWSRSLARVRGDGFGEAQKLAGVCYNGERVSLLEPRVLKGRSPEVAIGGVSAPRKALTTAAAGSRVRPLQPEKW